MITATMRQERILRRLGEIQDDKAGVSPVVRARAHGAWRAILQAAGVDRSAPGQGLRAIERERDLAEEQVRRDGANGDWGFTCYAAGFRRGVRMYRRIWGC